MEKAPSLGTRLPALLAQRGVEVVFGIPGVHNVEMYRGLPASGIRHVTPRHEQGAGFMADGFARASGRPGVCFVISGPGVGNIATAMGQAYADSVPILVIAAVNPDGRAGSGAGWLHDMPDQRGLAARVAGLARTVRDPSELQDALDTAFAMFSSARPRPAYIEVPTDVLTQPFPATALRLPAPSTPRESDGGAVTEAADRLSRAERPLILAGGGARRADVRALAERLDAPVVMTVNGRGLLPPGHPLAISLSPSLRAVRDLIADADAVLALGTELGPTDYDFDDDGGFPAPRGLIRVDIDPDPGGLCGPAELSAVADAAAFVSTLLSAVPEKQRGTGVIRAEDVRARPALSPATRGDLAILDLVRDTLPDARIVGDSTQLVYAGTFGFAAARPGGFFSSATGFGTLGYGLPAAVGAAIADKSPVVCLMGDGGLQFVLGELASAVEVQAPVIMLLHDNSGYGEIKSYMEGRDIVPVGVDIHTPDLRAIAAACGWTVTSPTADTLADALREAAARKGPTMLWFDDSLREAFRE